MLMGCGDPQGHPAAPATTPTTRTVERQRPAENDNRASRATSSRAGSLLTRNDLPPAAIERQVSFAAGGDQVCADAIDRGQARIVFDRWASSPEVESDYEAQPEMGEKFWICPAGFDDTSTVRIRVTDPAGNVREHFAGPAGETQWFWAAHPGDRLGSYRVEASQGTTRVLRSFRLRAASSPRIWIQDYFSSPGDTIDAMLAGFEPQEKLRLDVYYTADKRLLSIPSYRTSVLARVGIDGTGIHSLPTSYDDVAGCGGVRVVRLEKLGAGFCIAPRKTGE